MSDVSVAEAPPAARVTSSRGVGRRLLADKWAVAGAVVALFFVCLAVFAPQLSAITGNDPFTYHINALSSSGVPLGRFGGMSATHWLGVEPLTGRDMFSIVAYGARTSLLVGLGATVVSISLGTLVGVVAGYWGGLADTLLSRFTDLMLAFPSLIFMIALSALAPVSFPRQLFMILVIGVFGWPSTARITRGLTLSLRQRSFVTASRAIGTGPWAILRGDILPNLAATTTVLATMAIPGAIAAEASLSFLGIGMAPPTPSWGRAISSSVAWVRVDPWYLLAPGLALFLVTLALNLFGDGLRDAFDPKLARRAS